MTVPRTPLHLRILAGAAASAMLAGAASAQDKPATGPTSITAETATTSNGRIEASGHVEAFNDQGTFRADKMVSEANGVLKADGHVEAVTSERSLKADSATLDPNAAIISANGDIRIYQPDGSVEYASTLIFTRDLETGFATNFAARLPQNGTLAAANIVRRDASFTELNRAIFTACSLCDDKGADKTPTWAISADKVVRDIPDGSINYQNAWIRILGTPVLPLPFFSMADPSVDRKSGLLAPDFQHTERRGLSYEQPWLWAISPSQELVVIPQINAQVNRFGSAYWRKRFYSGILEAQTGYTYDRDFNTSGLKFGPNRGKAYIFADGKFALSPQWSWGFTAQAARDRRLFDQYSLDYSPPDRGLLLPGDRRLISQIYTTRQGDSSYLSIAAFGFQSLRPLIAPPGPFGLRPLEDDNTLPFVGPLVEFRYDPDWTVAGGRLRLVGSGVILNRKASPNVLGAAGIDSSRGTFEGDWRSSITLADGLRIEPFADIRADYYETGDLSTLDTANHANSRTIPTAGLDVSWPLVRTTSGMTTTIEPILQLAISPDSKANPQIPNEDSLAFQFDDTNLFQFNRSPGFDLYEGGQRLTAGVRTTFDWGDGRNARFLIGQSFRSQPDAVLPSETGLKDTTSDWIVAAEITPVTGLSLFSKGRFDNGDLQHIEAGLDANLPGGSGYLRYMRTEKDLTGASAEDVEGQGQIFITKTWGIMATATRDLDQKQWRRRSIGAVYQDDCLRFELLYQRDNNPLLGARDSSSVVFRLTLATLGDTGYNNAANRRPGAR